MLLPTRSVLGKGNKRIMIMPTKYVVDISVKVSESVPVTLKLIIWAISIYTKLWKW